MRIRPEKGLVRFFCYREIEKNEQIRKSLLVVLAVPEGVPIPAVCP